jgi:O-antigen/teichoic acid export membrane protein
MAGVTPGGEPDVLDSRAAGPLIVRGSAIRAVGFAAGSALSVVAAAIVTRELGEAGFGRYITVISLIAVVGSLSEAGMTNLGVREFSIRGGDDRDRLMRNLLGLRIVLSVVSGLAALVFAAASGYDDAMVAATAIAAAGIVVSNLQGAFSVPLSARLALGRLTSLELLRQVATTLLTVALAIAGAGLVAFVGITAVAPLAALLLTLWWVRGQIPALPAVDRRTWRTLLRVTGPFAAAAAVGSLYVYVIVLVMSFASTEQATGNFGASFRVFIVVASIAGLLVGSASALLARAARDDQARLAYALERLFEVALIAGAAAAVTPVVGAGVAIDVIAGPDYEDAVDALRIQGGAILASFLIATWSYALISLHRHTALLVCNALALAVGVALAVVLTPGGGAAGGAVATVAGETTLAIAYAIALMRRRRDLRPSLRVVPPVVLACAAALAAGLLLPLPELVRALIAGALVLAVTGALGAVPAELRDLLPSRLRRTAA